jgi:hypothetical protein
MSHREFQSEQAMESHFDWNGEAVLLNGVTEVDAIIDRGVPVTEYERGKGVLNRGKVLFKSSQSLTIHDYVVIDDLRWEIDNGRKPEDGARLWHIIRREAQYTMRRSAPFRGE